MHTTSFYSNNDDNYLDLSSLQTIEKRQELARLMMRLFDLWQIDTATQLNLLGLSESSRSLLSKYRKGHTPLPAMRDTLDRVGWLLSIHKALRLLYPKNPLLRYSWVSLSNKALAHQTPIEVMKAQGLIGIANIARYLDFQRGR